MQVQQSLSRWVEELNNSLFYQPNDEVAINAINEHIDTSLTVKINHNVHTYEQFKAGLLYIRSACITSLDSVSEILTWDDSEKHGGAVAFKTTFTSTDRASGKATKKISVIISTVKWVDGTRKLTELTEVEVE